MKRKRMIILILVIIMTLLSPVALTACYTDAQVSSKNISLEADQFKVLRRVVFYNGITGESFWVYEGFCSISADALDNQLEVTCKVGSDTYYKHFLGLSDNVSYMVQQIQASDVDPYHYKAIFKPGTFIPEIEVLTEN